METVEAGWDQSSFNRWTARNDEVLTYQQVKETAEEFNLNLDEALMFAHLFPGGEGL